MSDTTYRDTPDQTNSRMPGGVPFIIGNEAAERFSFYGMKGILMVFMTQHMLNASGEADYMNNEKAKVWYHLFTGLTYTFPILGAIIADVVLGKYRTILYISLMYCVGHACLAVMDVAPELGMPMKTWLIIGMFFIAIGAGAIKPCVSAHVGDQFGQGNKHLLTQIFNWFYFSINLGAASSMILTPILLAKVGPWLAFGLPGVLMALATFVFWLGSAQVHPCAPRGVEAVEGRDLLARGRAGAQVARAPVPGVRDDVLGDLRPDRVGLGPAGREPRPQVPGHQLARVPDPVPQPDHDSDGQPDLHVRHLPVHGQVL